MHFNSTVTAISTPPGKGGVALIRTSGPDAVAIVSRCFFPRSGKDFSATPSRTVVYGDIERDGERIDDGTAVIFRAPHSYTGEDTVEITCHGGVLVTRAVLETLLLAGASPAPAGEFTRRAFLSGKLTLTDAEAIGTLLDAKNYAQIRLCASDARDRLSRRLSDVHDRLLTVVSEIYAKIDFPDEDLAELSPRELTERLTAIAADLDNLLSTYKTGHAISEGIKTVIVGRPNVGKSSLYNLLCGDDYAIVTELEGTTRDVLERTATAGRVTLSLADTAGLRDTDDPVERIGVERARAHMQSAELILAVFDGSQPLTDEDAALIAELKQTDIPTVILLNKSDLHLLPEVRAAFDAFTHVLSLSAKTKTADALTALIEKLFIDGDISVNDTAILTSARQFAALTHARAALSDSLRAFASGLPADVASSDLEIALGALSELDGRAVSEEIVSGIFSKFCVGK
ncbi:MAG: tRNA uridine-5-carboxymethylaminomethyl(34) synthesis GTPase MnmE [Clostridia bacterium]|nr:tRNA uridine-5-carboxymethylaminomethyl(34) synthesis GTPase MnmE [Clostridia bacterium]